MQYTFLNVTHAIFRNQNLTANAVHNSTRNIPATVYMNVIKAIWHFKYINSFSVVYLLLLVQIDLIKLQKASAPTPQPIDILTATQCMRTVRCIYGKGSSNAGDFHDFIIYKVPRKDTCLTKPPNG